MPKRIHHPNVQSSLVWFTSLLSISAKSPGPAPIALSLPGNPANPAAVKPLDGDAAAPTRLTDGDGEICRCGLRGCMIAAVAWAAKPLGSLEMARWSPPGEFGEGWKRARRVLCCDIRRERLWLEGRRTVTIQVVLPLSIPLAVETSMRNRGRWYNFATFGGIAEYPAVSQRSSWSLSNWFVWSHFTEAATEPQGRTSWRHRPWRLFQEIKILDYTSN